MRPGIKWQYDGMYRNYQKGLPQIIHQQKYFLLQCCRAGTTRQLQMLLHRLKLQRQHDMWLLGGEFSVILVLKKFSIPVFI